MGNYSRFVRPGFVRFEAQGGDDTLLVSAYRSPDDRRWVVVAVNLSDQAVNLQLDVLNGQLPTQVEQFETSEQSDLVSMESKDGSTSWALAPLSVTTLVMDR